MEQEARYFFSNNMLGDLKKMLSKYDFDYAAKELTVMYDNPNPSLTFYDMSVDGRLRLRTSHVIGNSEFGVSDEDRHKSSCLLTWKRRLPENKDEFIRREEEIECHVNPQESEMMRQILSDVLKCTRISSYERIRNNFSSKCAKITCDQFPYGLMLEFELKDGFNDTDLITEVKSCGLSIKQASKISCDDMYVDLCRKNNINPKSDILFDDGSMPKI